MYSSIFVTTTCENCEMKVETRTKIEFAGCSPFNMSKSTQKPIRIGCYRSAEQSAVVSCCFDAFPPIQRILGVIIFSRRLRGDLADWLHRDSMLAAKQLVDAEKDALDFLVADYLAGSHFR